MLNISGVGLNISNCSLLTSVVSFVNNFFNDLLPDSNYKIIQSNCQVSFYEGSMYNILVSTFKITGPTHQI